jgi:peptide/nickel transport system ATP-binding protein
MTAASDILRIEDLGIGFALHAWDFDAVKGASFRVLPGKVTALVGESGSGKSVIAQTIMGILPKPGRIKRGTIQFSDPVKKKTIDLAGLDVDGDKYRHIRGGRISMIFQEPMTSLSPLHTIGDQVGEAYRIHFTANEKEVRAKTEEMLGLVGFPDRSSCRAACASAP